MNSTVRRPFAPTAAVEWSLDLETGTFAVSEAVATSVGWARDAVRSRAWWIDHIHPDDRERAVTAVGATLVGPRTGAGVSYRFRRPDGSYVRLLDRWSIERDGAGRAERLTGTVTCLVAHGGSTDAARLRLALDAGDIGTWDWDLVTNRRVWDARFRGIMGLRPDAEGGGSDDLTLGAVHPDDRERVQAAVDAACAVVADGDFDETFRVVWADGGIRWVAAKGKAIGEREGSLATRFLGVVIDVTDWHRAEVERARLLAAERHARSDAERARALAESANRTKAEFLAAMSHELRTPLNAIAGYVELLEMEVHGGLTDAQREDLRRVRQASAHLLRLISDILDFARVEASRVELRVTDVPLDTALAEALAMIEPLARSKGLTATYAGCDPRATVRADAERVRQILLNLLTNAVKFTRSGGSITLAGDPSGDPVCITVRDTGRGIAADKLDAIFEPFVQVGRTLASGEQGGIGLGLAISRELARRMHGDLTVYSVHGDGSTFTLTLPVGAPV